MTWSSYFALIGVWLAAIVSPGPDLLQIIRVGTKSWRAGVACACGIMLGNMIWIFGSLLGLSALLQAAPQILTVLQLVGGGYLWYMGLGALRSGLLVRRQQTAEAAPSEISEPPAAKELSPRRALGVGLATNLSNPKAVLFFAAVFAQFVKPAMGWQWTVVIVATLAVLGIAWFVGFALLVDKIGAWLATHRHWVDVITGLIFVALASWIIVESLTHISPT